MESFSSGVIFIVEWIFLKWGDGYNAGGVTLQYSAGR